ncbi:glycosyltransferase [Actinomadura rudentiformis]|uniref:Glucosyl-3-phosphoglycerate synthase n=1 Tax=Actinomadura rudentiformis TaxID=359158 RepID=A0A6H9YG38_9ACTN|nr:glycosyltransferase [Actinomadura rudentiformis]KAB2340826.1 glycosyltransferase [Actinomadura rudentiformis]
MTTRPWIDPALGIIDVNSPRSLENLKNGTVSIVIPAHNEEETVGKVTREAFRAIELLGVDGEVIVSASGCTDATADLAAQAGAHIVESPAGKGNAMTAGIKASSSDVVCLIDGDFRYLGDEPLAVGLVKPILQGVAHATIADLYWRPIYPQLWLFGFFAPLAGRIFPELLPTLGSTPWSGQRAALRELWPTELPDDFTSDLAILLHWHDLNIRLRPVATDDWVNPQRPKPDLMHKEFTLFADYALSRERIDAAQREHLETWFASVHAHMAGYRPDQDDPQQFERSLMRHALAELDRAAQPL